MALNPSGASKDMGTPFNTFTYQTTRGGQFGAIQPNNASSASSATKQPSDPSLAVSTDPAGNPMMQGDHTVAGTQTSWHVVVLWFLGAVALLALADPAPQIATGLVIILILGTLLNNWPVYKTYLGLK